MSPDADAELIGEYDEIETPPVKPYVVRHRRFASQRAVDGRVALFTSKTRQRDNAPYP